MAAWWTFLVSKNRCILNVHWKIQHCFLKIIKKKPFLLIIMKTVEPFFLTPSHICIIIPLSRSVLIRPSHANCAFMDSFSLFVNANIKSWFPTLISQSFRDHVIKCKMYILVFYNHSCSSNFFNWTVFPSELKETTFNNKIISTGGNFTKNAILMPV